MRRPSARGSLKGTCTMATASLTQDTTADGAQELCEKCGAELAYSESWRAQRVCPQCGFHASLGAHARIAGLVDADSFEETNQRLVSVDPLGFSDLQPYRERVLRARAKT